MSESMMSKSKDTPPQPTGPLIVTILRRFWTRGDLRSHLWVSAGRGHPIINLLSAVAKNTPHSWWLPYPARSMPEPRVLFVNKMVSEDHKYDFKQAKNGPVISPSASVCLTEGSWTGNFVILTIMPVCESVFTWSFFHVFLVLCHFTSNFL